MKHIEQSLELESGPGAFWIVQQLLGKVMAGFWVEGEGQDDRGRPGGSHGSIHPRKEQLLKSNGNL